MDSSGHDYCDCSGIRSGARAGVAIRDHDVRCTRGRGSRGPEFPQPNGHLQLLGTVGQPNSVVILIDF